MAKDLPGFFFDEEKGKYFPNIMKAAYEQKKMAREAAEKERKMQEDWKNTHEMDLYKYLGTQPKRFDRMKERISRLEVIPMTSSADCKYYFDLKNERYYIMSRVGRSLHIRTYSLPSDASSSGDIIDESWFENGHSMISFAVHYINETESLYFFMYDSWEKIFCRVSDKGGTNSIEFDLAGPGSYVVDYERDCYIVNWMHNCNELEVMAVEKNDNMKGIFKCTDRNLYVLWHPEIGYVQSLSSATFRFQKNDTYLRFNYRDSAKWLHYYNGNIVVMTFSDIIGSININEPKSLIPLFSIKYSEIYNRESKVLLVQAVDRIIVFGYIKGKKLAFYDLDTYKVIHILSFDYEIQQFKLSDDLKNIFIIRYHD